MELRPNESSRKYAKSIASGTREKGRSSQAKPPASAPATTLIPAYRGRGVQVASQRCLILRGGVWTIAWVDRTFMQGCCVRHSSDAEAHIRHPFPHRCMRSPTAGGGVIFGSSGNSGMGFGGSKQYARARWDCGSGALPPSRRWPQGPGSAAKTTASLAQATRSRKAAKLFCTKELQRRYGFDSAFSRWPFPGNPG